jgi:hypothetical protein
MYVTWYKRDRLLLIHLWNKGQCLETRLTIWHKFPSSSFPSPRNPMLWWASVLTMSSKILITSLFSCFYLVHFFGVSAYFFHLPKTVFPGCHPPPPPNTHTPSPSCYGPVYCMNACKNNKMRIFESKCLILYLLWYVKLIAIF